MKKVIALVLACVLLFAAHAAFADASREETYAMAMDALYGTEKSDIECAEAGFSAVGGYKQAKLYLMYARALLLLYDDSEQMLDEASAILDELGMREAFRSELEGNGFCSLEDLNRYIVARRYEQSGSAEQAIEIYRSIDVLDSFERGRNLGQGQSAAHTHSWIPATCTEPMICQVCGEMSGSPLGHMFSDATCTAEATCIRCGITSGNPLGHLFDEATCVTPMTCRRCGFQSGEPAEHQWLEATYRAPKTCARCGATEGKKLQGITDAQAKPGSIVKFGRYEQDANVSNGPEDIEWLVIANKNGKALLITYCGLDAVPFNEIDRPVMWSDSALREWLNGAFYEDSFVAAEKELIQTTTVEPDTNNGFQFAGKDVVTQDKVFILSSKEAETYFANQSYSRACRPTTAAIFNEAYVNPYYGTCSWWLRTPGGLSNYAVTVSSDKTAYMNYKGNDVRDRDNCVRPVIWISLI